MLVQVGVPVLSIQSERERERTEGFARRQRLRNWLAIPFKGWWGGGVEGLVLYCLSDRNPRLLGLFRHGSDLTLADLVVDDRC